jgi:hypothetical protein
MANAKRNIRIKSTQPPQGVSYRIFDDILALASTMAHSQKDFGAGKLQSLAAATRDYAASMADLPNLRTHVVSASDSIEGLADYVMHTDIDHMVHDAGTFARRYPLATLGLTIGAGIAASRLLRPSQPAPPARPKLRAAKKKLRKQAVRTRSAANGSAHAHA